jgi:hypothetical protein
VWLTGLALTVERLLLVFRDDFAISRRAAPELCVSCSLAGTEGGG